jgi:hypothetical protein
VELHGSSSSLNTEEEHCACNSVRHSETSPRRQLTLARGDCRHPDSEDPLAATVCQLSGYYFVFDQASQQIVARSAELDGNDVYGS